MKQTIKLINRYHKQLVELKKNKPLSDAVSEIKHEADRLFGGYDELGMYNAPSECYPNMEKAQSVADAIANKHGFLNYKILLDVIKLRTTAKVIQRYHLAGLQS